MKREKLINFRGQRSQMEMANIYGVSQQTWSMWENGKKTPSVITMKRLENDVGCSMEEIFFDIFNNQK